MATDTNGVDWSGGRVLVEHDATGCGWNVWHLPSAGGEYGIDWKARKLHAMIVARERAEQFGAKLLVEA